MLDRFRTGVPGATALAFLTALCLSLLLSTSAAAQEAGQSQPPPAMPETAEVPLDDETLEAFVEVAVDVQDVLVELRQNMEGVEDEAAGRELMKQANQDIQAIIDKHPGIDETEYRAIALQTRSDPELKERLDGMVRDAMAEQSGG